MKKIFLTSICLLSICGYAHAQSLCSSMAAREGELDDAANKYFRLVEPTAAEDAQIKKTIDAYKKYFEDIVNETWYTQKSFASVMELKTLWIDMMYLEKKKDYNAMAKDAAHGMLFFSSIDDAYDHEMECGNGGVSTTKLHKFGYRQIMSGFLSKAVLANMQLGRNDLAIQDFMLGIGKDAYGRDANTYEMTGDILDYRLKNKISDDTTWWAAYLHLYSCRAELSLGQIAARFSKFHEADALEILSDPKFEKRKIKNAPLAGEYGYNGLYVNLLMYLTDDTTGRRDGMIKQVVRLTINSVNANGTKWFPESYFSDCMLTGNLYHNISKGSDKELMLLVADFISDHYHKSENYRESYGAYLLYHAAGEEKKANKVYNRIAKGTQDRFKKID